LVPQTCFMYGPVKKFLKKKKKKKKKKHEC
jgi:hypothetical protein